MPSLEISFLKSFLIILVSAIAMPGPASATAHTSPGAVLRGRVLDQSGEPVAGATVYLSSRYGLRWTTVSDDHGSYDFNQIPAGDYLLEVEAVNFTRLVEPVRLGAGEERSLDLTLVVRGIAEQVLITASATAQPVDEISKSVSVIGSQQIESRNEMSISEALRLTPGLRVSQLGGPGTFTTIRIRGLRGEDTAILIDGMRFRDAATTAGDATSFIEDLLVVNTDRLEVLRGSGSSLYGTNAIGGVVNVITDQGGGPAHGQIQLEGGSLSLFRGRMSLAGGAWENRLGYSLGLAHLNVSSGVDGNDATRNTGGQGMARYSFTPAISLTGRVFASDAFLQLNDSPFAAPIANPLSKGVIHAVPLSFVQQRRLESGLPVDFAGATLIPGLDDPDSRRDSNFFSGALTYVHQLHNAASYRVGFHRTATNRIFSDGPAGVRFEPGSTTSSELYGRIDALNARTDLEIGRGNLLSAGYEFEREYYRNHARDENPALESRVNALARITQRSHTFFAQDQLRLIENRLQFSAAGRVQTFSLSRPVFEGGPPLYTGVQFEAPPTAYTGDGSISYLLTSTRTKLRGHVGNGYRAPSLFQRFGSSYFSGSFSPFGDPRLRPDRSISFDSGIDQTIGGGRAQLSATYFYTRLQEVIIFDSSGFIDDVFGRFIGYRNTGGGLARGVELSLQARPIRSLDLEASYTYTNADERTPAVTGFVKTLGVSDHTFTLLISQQVGRRLSLVFDLFAASDYAFPFSVSRVNRAFILDGPVKADFGFAHTFPMSGDRSMKLYAKVENILDRPYFENGFRAPGGSLVGGLTVKF